MQRQRFIDVVIIILGLLMWYSNTDLFQRLEALSDTETTTWRNIINVILPLGYSTLTAISIRILPQYKYVAGFAAFDSAAVFLHFQHGIPAALLNWIGAVYYAALMFFLVSMIWLIVHEKWTSKEETAEETAEQDQEPEAPPTLAVAETSAVVEPPRQIEAHQPDEMQITYTTVCAKIRGLRNGYASEDEKNAKIRSLIQSLPDGDVKEQAANMVFRQYRITLD